MEKGVKVLCVGWGSPPFLCCHTSFCLKQTYFPLSQPLLLTPFSPHSSYMHHPFILQPPLPYLSYPAYVSFPFSPFSHIFFCFLCSSLTRPFIFPHFLHIKDSSSVFFLKAFCASLFTLHKAASTFFIPSGSSLPLTPISLG